MTKFCFSVKGTKTAALGTYPIIPSFAQVELFSPVIMQLFTAAELLQWNQVFENIALAGIQLLKIMPNRKTLGYLILAR